MKIKEIKFVIYCFVCFYSTFCFGQQANQKNTLNAFEEKIIHYLFEEILIEDQRYRSYLTFETTDDQIIHTIDSIMENEGIKEGMMYQKSLQLKLAQSTKDSLNELQKALDLKNHLIFRGLIETYGYISEDVSEKSFIQQLLLLHPPASWEVNSYLSSYSEFLLIEVQAGRMPAKSYANFYDNILAKILKKPQLYGTGQAYDRKTNQILPAIITSINKTNKARKKIGLAPLKEDEYRLSEK